MFEINIKIECESKYELMTKNIINKYAKRGVYIIRRGNIYTMSFTCSVFKIKRFNNEIEMVRALGLEAKIWI